MNFSEKEKFCHVINNFIFQLKTSQKKSGKLQKLLFAHEFGKCSHHDLHIFTSEVVMKCCAFLM